MGLFDGCRCSRPNIHGSKQLVYVVQGSSETPSWRRCSWPRIAELRPVLPWPPLAFLNMGGENAECETAKHRFSLAGRWQFAIGWANEEAPISRLGTVWVPSRLVAGR